MKFPLTQIQNKDVIPCTQLPMDVRDHIQSILSTPKRPKTPKKNKPEQAAVLANVVLEVGVENVVQVITDTSASYVYAGRLLMGRYGSLFWSTCAAYCIDKMLEDIGRQNWVIGGQVIPTLQRAAARILSQPCSSLWYTWNWST
ncbi:hypothetical protein AHAS_Ahas05G0046000 [Arachis hypogaea]